MARGCFEVGDQAFMASLRDASSGDHRTNGAVMADYPPRPAPHDGDYAMFRNGSGTYSASTRFHSSLNAPMTV